MEQEQIFGESAVRFLYGTSVLSRWIYSAAVSKVPSKFLGLFYHSSLSARLVKSFVERYKINLADFETGPFKSFNQFFYRKFKDPEKRPFPSFKNRLGAGAEGRYLLQKNLTAQNAIQIKGHRFYLEDFLNTKLVGSYDLLVSRLCPVDYHRFHFMTDGKVLDSSKIPGVLDSVHPIAIQKRPAVLAKNARVITRIESEILGTYWMVEVGAFGVASIHQTYKDQVHSAGQEKGYFAFGGSTVVWVIPSNRIQYEPTLERYSEQDVEVYFELGQQIAFQSMGERP